MEPGPKDRPGMVWLHIEKWLSPFSFYIWKNIELHWTKFPLIMLFTSFNIIANFFSQFFSSKYVYFDVVMLFQAFGFRNWNEKY